MCVCVLLILLFFRSRHLEREHRKNPLFNFPSLVLQVVSALVAHGHSVSVGLCQGYSAVLLPQLSSPDSDLGVISGEAASWLGETFKRTRVSQTALKDRSSSESCYMCRVSFNYTHHFFNKSMIIFKHTLENLFVPPMECRKIAVI
jgi:hypothetical protein